VPKFFKPDDFQRAFDELFDDLLVERWRVVRATGGSENTIVLDHGDRYEVRIALGDADCSKVEVEVSERRLTVRVPSESRGVSEGSFSFSEPVEREAVTAKASGGTLAIVLPKMRRTRRVQVGQT